jgi:hypothetical protein
MFKTILPNNEGSKQEHTMALDTKQNKRSDAGDSKLDSYGVWVKKPPIGATAQDSQNFDTADSGYDVDIKAPSEKTKVSRKESSTEISSDVFLDDDSFDSSFEDVFESIESETTGVSTPSEVVESVQKDETLPEEFINTESCDNVKFTVSDSEMEIITKEVVEMPTVQEKDCDPAFAALGGSSDKNEKPAREESGFDSAAKGILKQIAAELAALKNEISLLKADFDELKNQEIIRPAQSLDLSEAIDSSSREDETAGITDDFAAETENQSDAEESRNGFFSEDSDDETIALSGDELQNILTNSEFSAGEENGGIAEGISGAIDNTDGELPEISEESDRNIFIEEDPVQNEGEKKTTVETEDALDSIVIESEIENIDFENKIEDAVHEIQNAGGTEITGIDIESEDLHEPEFADIEFDDFDEFEEAALPEEIDIPMADKDDILVDEDFEIKNIAEVTKAVETPLDNDLIADEEIELAKESSEADDIETEIKTDGRETAKKSESVEEELDDTPTDRVFGKQWGEAAAPQEDAPQAPRAEKLGGGLKEQVKTVLSYMDKLLENLPEEKISEFARSEYFDTYKKLFEELGIA